MNDLLGRRKRGYARIGAVRNGGIAGRSTVTVAAADAYGPHRDELIYEVGRDKLAPEMQVGVGDRLEGTDATGTRLQLTVVEVTDSAVKLDANHPLAGEDLTFELKLVEIA